METTTTNTGTMMRVGDILQSAWGYSMTLVCYYEVVAVSKSGLTVTVRELRTRRTPTRWDGFTSHVEPVLAGGDRFDPSSKPLRRRVKSYGGRPYVAINTCENAYLMEAVELLDGAEEDTAD